MKFHNLLLFLVLITLQLERNECSRAEKSLMFDLFKPENYDPKIRPVMNASTTLTVGLTVALQQIISLNEKNQILTTSMYPIMNWTDEYLTWDPKNYSGIERIIVPSKDIWIPNILIYNSVVDSFHSVFPAKAIISYNGGVEWMPPGLFKTYCSVDTKYFPFDDQNCKIKFGIWEYDIKEVNLRLSEKVDTSEVTSKEWQLISMTAKRNSVKYPCCKLPFVDITFYLHMRRQTLFYGFNFILPCFLVNSLAILVFLLPADSGERITLSITILLALVVFLQILAETLPPTDIIPLLGNYFASSIVMVSSSVLVTVVSLNFHGKNATNAHAMPKWIRWLFLGLLPKYLKIKRPGEMSCKNKFVDVTKQYEEHDPVLIRQRWKLKNLNCNGTLVDKENNICITTNLKKPDISTTETSRELSRINRQLDKITSRMKDEDEDEKCALEWKFAAHVLDTFAIWFYTFYFVFTTFLTIGIAPGILLPYECDNSTSAPEN